MLPVCRGCWLLLRVATLIFVCAHGLTLSDQGPAVQGILSTSDGGEFANFAEVSSFSEHGAEVSSLGEHGAEVSSSSEHGAVPPVKLPSGVTITGSILNGFVRNQTFGIDFYDKDAALMSYAGIRYATAGRFQPPELYEYPKGTVVDGTKLGSICSQSYLSKGKLAGSEDCLFLNVYVPPGTKAHDKKPVIVFIHGGNLVFGSSSTYHGMLNWLGAEGDCVMVGINYRLNVFGFFYSQYGDMKANFGNRDQIKSLEWVRNNIGAFGGDKDRVTIMGHSGGARSVSVIYMSPLSQGLFHRAIAQSPGALDANFFQPIEKVGSTMGAMCEKAAGCQGGDVRGVKCMRKKTAEEVNKACAVYTNPNSYLANYGYYMSGFDGEVLPFRISDPLCKKTPVPNGNVPIMAGTLTNEWTFFDKGSKVVRGTDMIKRTFREHVSSALGAVDAAMNVFGDAKCTGTACSDMSHPAPLQMASNFYALGAIFPLQGAGNGSRYRYDLNIDLGGNALGSGHCGDLCLLFSPKPWIMPFQKGACGDGGHQAEWIALGKTMRAYWTSFARDGVPSAADLSVWVPMDQKRRTPVMNMALGTSPAILDKHPFSAASEEYLVTVICSNL